MAIITWHIATIMLFTWYRYAPPPSLLSPNDGKGGKERTPLLAPPFLSFSLFQTCCQSYNFVVFCECWKATTFPSLGEIAARFFLLSPGRAYTWEACLCPLGPRSSQISEQLVWDSELKLLSAPAGLELEARES